MRVEETILAQEKTIIRNSSFYSSLYIFINFSMESLQYKYKKKRRNGDDEAIITLSFALNGQHLDTVTFWNEALINLSCEIEHLYNLLLCFYALQWQGIQTQPLFLLMLLAEFDSLSVMQFLVDPSVPSLEMWPEKIF